MSAVLPVRTVRSSMVPMLVAMLVLAVQCLSAQLPLLDAAARPMNAAAALGIEWTICHTGDPDDGQAPATPARHVHDCVLCPACHIAASATLAEAAAVAMPRLQPTLIAPAAPPPPATGPPHPIRLADRPTGPPSPFI